LQRPGRRNRLTGDETPYLRSSRCPNRHSRSGSKLPPRLCRCGPLPTLRNGVYRLALGETASHCHGNNSRLLVHHSLLRDTVLPPLLSAQPGASLVCHSVESLSSACRQFPDLVGWMQGHEVTIRSISPGVRETVGGVSEAWRGRFESLVRRGMEPEGLSALLLALGQLRSDARVEILAVDAGVRSIVVVLPTQGGPVIGYFVLPRDRRTIWVGSPDGQGFEFDGTGDCWVLVSTTGRHSLQNRPYIGLPLLYGRYSDQAAHFGVSDCANPMPHVLVASMSGNEYWARLGLDYLEGAIDHGAGWVRRVLEPLDGLIANRAFSQETRHRAFAISNRLR